MKKYLAFAMVAMALASCSNDDELAMKDNGSDVITLTSVVAPQTRSVSQTLQGVQIAASQKVGVFIDGSANIADNAEFTTDGSGALNSGNTYTFGANATVDVIAYQPYNAKFAGKAQGDFSVSTAQNEDANYLASDLLYAKKTGCTKSTDAIALEFNHLLAKVNVNLSSSDFTADELKAAKVSILGTKIATTFNPADGTIGELTGNATAIVATDGSTTANTANTASAIIIPQTVGAAKFIQVEIAGKKYSYTLAAEKIFDPAKVYAYGLTVKKADVEMSLSSSSINNWTGGEGDDAGVANEEDGKVTATFKTLTADGTANVTTTTKVTLTFDQAIEGLTADDITLTAGTTGATKGALTDKSGGKYELALTGIIAGGEISVTVAKNNVTFTPDTKTVTVNAARIIVNVSWSYNDGQMDVTRTFKAIAVQHTFTSSELTSVEKGAILVGYYDTFLTDANTSSAAQAVATAYGFNVTDIAITTSASGAKFYNVNSDYTTGDEVSVGAVKWIICLYEQY